MFWSRSDCRASIRFAHSNGTPRRSAIFCNCSNLPSGSEPVSWKSRPTNVDFPWSTWPTMTILSCSVGPAMSVEEWTEFINKSGFLALGCNLTCRAQRLWILFLVFLTEVFQQRQLDDVSLAPGGSFTGNNVAQIGDAKYVHNQPARL